MNINMLKCFKTCNFKAFLSVLLVVSFVLASQPAEAAIESREVLKTFFETGDVPTESQFGNLIDSMVHQLDDGLSYDGATPDAVSLGALLNEGEEIGPASFFAPIAGLGEDWVGQSGFLGLTLQLNSQTHYGYLQISSPPGDQYPMLVEYVVFEDQPNVPIVAETIPEPATISLVALVLLSTFCCRR